MKYTRSGFLALTSTLALVTAPLSTAVAQDGQGLRGTLSFSQGLSVSDNANLVASPSDTDITSQTGLTFGLTSETRTQQFSLSVGTILEGDLGSNSAGDDFEFTSDTVDLNYTRLGATSRLTFGALYQRREIDDLEYELDFDPDTLVIDGGSRERTRLSVGVETGIGTPLNLKLDVASDQSTYTDTVDPDLTDTESVSVDALARFRLSPTLTARALAGTKDTKDDDAVQTNRDSRYLGFGIEGDATASLSYSADVIYDRTETTTNAPSSSTEDGIGLTLAMTQERASGSIGGTLSSRVDDSGRRTSASVTRSMELPTGDMSFSLGLVDQEGASIRPTVALSVSRDLPSGALSAQLSQTPRTDDGAAYLNTTLSVNYAQTINDVSQWSAGLRYVDTNALGFSDDASRTTATLTYRRDLTEDWGLRTGYEHIIAESDGDPNRKSNTVFMSIERDFTFGF